MVENICKVRSDRRSVSHLLLQQLQHQLPLTTLHTRWMVRWMCHRMILKVLLTTEHLLHSWVPLSDLVPQVLPIGRVVLRGQLSRQLGEVFVYLTFLQFLQEVVVCLSAACTTQTNSKIIKIPCSRWLHRPRLNTQVTDRECSLLTKGQHLRLGRLLNYPAPLGYKDLFCVQQRPKQERISVASTVKLNITIQTRQKDDVIRNRWQIQVLCWGQIDDTRMKGV